MRTWMQFGMNREARKRTVLEVRGARTAAIRPKCAMYAFLTLAEFDFLKLQSLTLSANNSFRTAFTLADRLFEILSLFYSDNQATLLHAAVKAAYEVLG